MAWSLDVLGEYFRVCPTVPRLQSAKSRYEVLVGRLEYTPSFSARSVDSALPPDSIEGLRKLVMGRHSVRVFEQTPVSHDLLDEAFELAR